MSQQLEGEHSINRKQTKKSTKQGWMVELRDWLITAAVVFVIMSLVNIFIFSISTVNGQSMQPTLWQGEKLIVNKISLMFVSPKHGDIVVLNDPSTGPDKKEYLVKRVIGIPGDIVEVKEHKLYVNGKVVDEPYIDTEIQDPDFAALTVEPGRYFVMGDNRHESASKDSRYFGSVSEEDIVGRADFIFWPLSKLNKL